MLSGPIHSNFRFYFPADYFYPKVLEQFIPIYRNSALPYTSIPDFVNDTIINAFMPGLSDPGTKPQVHHQGNFRTFRSGLKSEESISKEFDVTFKLSNNYLNWLIMRENSIEYLKFKSRAEGDETFHPDMMLHVLDDNDNIIMQLIYKDVRFIELSGIEFNKQRNGIGSKEFTMKFAFNSWQFANNFSNIQDQRSTQAHEYDYSNSM